MEIVKSRFSRKYYVVNSHGIELAGKLKIRNVWSSDELYIIELHDYTQLIFFKRAEKQAPTSKGDYFWRSFKINEYYFYYATVNNEQIKHYICYKTGEVVHTGVSPEERFVNELLVAYDHESRLYGYLDANMQWKIPPKYGWTSNFNANGHAIVKIAEYEYAVIDKEGECVLSTLECSGMQFLNDSYLCIGNRNNSKKGIIDIKGNQILDCVYDDITCKYDCFLLKKDGKYGISDSNGNIKYDCEYIKWHLGLSGSEIVLTKEEIVNIESLKG